MRLPLLVSAIVISVSTAVASSSPSFKRTGNPCDIGDDYLKDVALNRYEAVLTDTGETAGYFEDLRVELGLQGVHMEDLTIVADTVACRRALNSWKSYYATLGVGYDSSANDVTGGLLVRMMPNRYVLATPVFHAYTLVTLFVTDSQFVMIRPGM